MTKTKLARTIALLKRGWTTPLECALAGGVLSLSQRVSLDLRDYKIERRWLRTAGGSRVMAYRIKP